MFDRIEQIVAQHADIEARLADPEVANDGELVAELARRHAELSQIVATFHEHAAVVDDLAVAREMAAEDDDEVAEATAMAEGLERRRVELEEHLQLLLLPKDPHEHRDVIVEVRAAAGGDEAGLFAQELVDMYRSYASRRGWRSSVLSESRQDIGGVKECTFEVSGVGVWAELKHESGVHRVQRVPATESQGRIHTSTASVAVMAEAEEVDVQINPQDLRVEVFRSSGPGGQSVNTTDSAVRITHVPTGVVATCQDQKSQHQNRDRAMKILRSRLLQAEQDRVSEERADARRGLIGSGDRSEKIRTYNFPQTRITDHRIGLTVHNLDGVLGGDLSVIVDALRAEERAAQLAQLAEQA